MSIDELVAAAKSHLNEESGSHWRLKKALEAYEATKAAEQPVGMTFDEWVNSIPPVDIVKPSTLRTCWNAATATKRESPQSDDKSVCMGVGDGAGKHFVWGSYDTIKMLQKRLLEREVEQPVAIPIEKAIEECCDLLREDALKHGYATHLRGIVQTLFLVIKPWLPHLRQPVREVEQPVGQSLAQEIKPCPYVNGFSSDNSAVNFMLKRYERYSDFVLFEDGKPARCFRFAETPKRESSAEEMKLRKACDDEYEALEFEKNELESENEILIARIAKLEEGK